MSSGSRIARAIRFLRICFWAGAVVDAGAAVQMLSPRVFAFAYQVPDFSPGPDFRFAMGLGAPLMIGWTVLLLWADRAPLARKGVLPITVVPVILGIAANQAVALADGFIPLVALAPVWTLQLILTVAFMGSYLYARRAEKQAPDPR